MFNKIKLINFVVFFSRKLLDSHSRNNVRVILKIPTKSWNPVNESYNATYWDVCHHDSGSAGPVFVKNAQFLNYIPFLRH